MSSSRSTAAGVVVEQASRPIRVATVTVGINERTWLDECLTTLLATEAIHIDLAVWYVDNASTDGSAEHVASKYPDVQVVRNSGNLGFARANNIGIRAAVRDGADYVFLVNPDTRTPSDLIRDLTVFMERWTDYGAIGPLQYTYGPASPPELNDLNKWSKTVLKWREANVFIGDRSDRPPHASPPDGRAPATIEFAYIEGAAIFLRTSMLRAVGLFDEALHTYYEDTDLCRRARWAGWRVAVVTDAGIQHFGGGSTGGSPYRRIQMRRGRYFYLLTDIDWAAPDIASLASRWLRRDLRGHSVGGDTTWWRGTWETLHALSWLLGTAAWIRRRRKAHRLMAGAARRSSVGRLEAVAGPIADVLGTRTAP